MIKTSVLFNSLAYRVNTTPFMEAKGKRILEYQNPMIIQL
jgi:hypothetical protein